MNIPITQLLLIQQKLDEYDHAWKIAGLEHAAKPDLADYLLDSDQATRLECLVQLVAIDLEHRLSIVSDSHTFSSNAVEYYLKIFPELQDSPTHIVDLACAEYRCRARLNDPPDVKEYLNRFPSLHKLSGQLAATIAELQAEQACITLDLPDYQLLNVAGEGGRGVVYRAWQKSLQRFVAIKVLKPNCQVSLDEQRRFRREGETLARLSHPNIVKVYAVESALGQNVLIMEWIDGHSLDAVEERASTSITTYVRIVRDICEAVGIAHEQGILHRDIKPANILISQTGAALVTDFGLAKDLRQLSVDTATLTRTREIIGTPGFMPPEQIDGRYGPSGPWSDLYAIGATLYYVLTGRPPLRGSTTWETFEMILNDEPVSPRQLNPRITKDLETVCLKCLAKNPNDRYLTAHALAEELDRVLRGEPVLARPLSRMGKLVRWSWKHPQQAVLTAVSITAVSVLLLGSLTGSLFYSRLFYSEQAERKRAAQALSQAEASEYASHIREAQLQYELDYFVGMKNALQRAQPSDGQVDRRGWEWYYLNSLMERGNQRFVIGNEQAPWVGSCDITTDARYLAAGSSVPWYESMDQKSRARLNVWNTPEGTELLSVELPGNVCSDVAICADGSLVAACVQQADRARDPLNKERPSLTVWYSSSNTQLVVYDVATGHLQLSVELADRDYTRLQFAESKAIILGLSPARLFAVDLDNGAKIWSVDGITASCVEDDVVHVQGGTASVLSLATGQPVNESVATPSKPKHYSNVGTLNSNQTPLSPLALRFRNWTNNIEAKITEKEVTVESTSNRQVLASIRVDAPISACAFSSDDQLIAIGRGDGAIELWKLHSKVRLRVLSGHRGQVSHLEFADSNGSLVSGGWDGELLVWDLKSANDRSEHYRVGVGSERSFEAFTLTAEEQLRGVQLEQDIITTWQLKKPAQPTHQRLSSNVPATAPGRSASMSSDGSKLICADHSRKSAICWDLNSSQQLHQVQTSLPIRFVEIGQTGAFVGIASWGVNKQDILTAQLQVLRVSDGARLVDQTISGRRIWRMAINDSHRLLAVLETEPMSAKARHIENQTTTLALWNLDSKGEVWRKELANTTGLYLGVALSDDGTKLAVGELGGEIEICRIDNGDRIVKLESGIENLEDLCFSPDASRVVGISRKELVLWDTQDGYRLLSLPQPQTNFDPIFNPQAIFSPNGKTLVTNGFDQTLMVYETE